MMQQMLVGLGGGGPPILLEDVFKTKIYTGTGAYGLAVTTGLDYTEGESLIWTKRRIRNDAYGFDHIVTDTKRSRKWLVSNKLDQEYTTPLVLSLTSTGYTIDNSYSVNKPGDGYVSWNFKAVPGFMDIVTWTGNGGSGLRAINHNLGSTPGFLITKNATSANTWAGWHKDLTSKNYYLQLSELDQERNGSQQIWDATDTTFSIHSGITGNIVGNTYVAYLFASDQASFGAGRNESIIHCGTYNGTSSSVTETCGFRPAWLLVKVVSHGGYPWAIIDTTRNGGGTAMGNLLSPNSNAHETTYGNIVTTSSTGFTIPAPGASTPSALNDNGRKYVYVAIRAE